MPANPLRDALLATIERHVGRPDGALVIGRALPLATELAEAALAVMAAEPVTQYGFRLRDTTLLEFDTRAERDARQADFVRAEWEVTPLTRTVQPAQYGEWTEEAR
jgi:hypothetical protein